MSILDFSAIHPLKLSESVRLILPKIIQGRTAHEKDPWRRNHPCTIMGTYPRILWNLGSVPKLKNYGSLPFSVG
jgi:hypothetical protein